MWRTGWGGRGTGDKDPVMDSGADTLSAGKAKDATKQERVRSRQSFAQN